jgi:hypothetical protein
VVGSCKYGDEPSGSGATELVITFSLEFQVMCNLKCTIDLRPYIGYRLRII